MNMEIQFLLFAIYVLVLLSGESIDANSLAISICYGNVTNTIQLSFDALSL